MALSDPRDTLAYHQSRVLTSNRKMYGVPCSAVSQQIAKYQASVQLATPETEALVFYGLNHGVAMVQQAYAPLEPLAPGDQAFVERYHARVGPMAVRAFYYLVLICTREARHNQSLAKDLPEITKKFGAPVASFFNGIKGGESSIHQKLLDHPPATTIGNYCKALQWVFYHSKWNSGFGGSAWGAVADCLVRFVTGEFTAEVMLDTNWTLAHNNGPIFNKGMMYSMYSHYLVRILDIQRSGQIPEAILHDVTGMSYVPGFLTDDMMWLKERFGGIGSYVDWFTVEALGSVHKYPNEKAQQVKEHGESPAAAEALKKAKAAEAAAAAAAEKAQMLWEKAHYEIMPGLVVEKIIRNAA